MIFADDGVSVDENTNMLESMVETCWKEALEKNRLKTNVG